MREPGQLGLSFVEILVVIVLMGLMLVGGNWYFSGFANRNAVEDATRKIWLQIETARSHARISRIPQSQNQNINIQYVGVLLNEQGIALVSDIGNTYSRVTIDNRQLNIDQLSGCDLCFGAGEANLVDEFGVARPYDYVVTIRVSLQNDSNIYRDIEVASTGLIKRGGI